MLTKSKRHLSNQIKIGSILKQKSMETHRQHIELINSYINNLLSKEARQDFESRLQSDIEFNSIYEEQIIFVNGLKRTQIKTDIQKAKRLYQIEKWLKISGISIIVITTIVLLYTLVFNTSKIELVPNNDNLNTIIIDSTSINKSIYEITIDTSEIDDIETELKFSIHSSEAKPQEEKERITSIYSEQKKQAQIIKINTQNDTIIKCSEGTILKITKGSFINPITQKAIIGLIDLEVTEYYKLSDMLLANLSTMSNGAQLETGGMLFIEATQDDTKLELNENTPIEISFPTKNKKIEMQLFSGEWNANDINWKLQNNVTDDSITIEELEENIEVPFSVVDQIPTFPGCENDDDKIRRQCTIDAISKFVIKNFNTDIIYDLGLKEQQRINSIFKIDQKGNIISIRSRAADSRLSEEADRVLGLLPKMVPGMQRGRPVSVPYSLPILLNVDRENINKRLEANLITGVLTSSSIVDSISFQDNLRTFEVDTIFNNRRGIVEIIREIMHDKDFVVDSVFLSEWDAFKKQKQIRNMSLPPKNNVVKRAVILRKSLFEMENTRFKILKDDSITRGGHVIRIPWNETQIPTTTRVMNIIPKRKFYAGNDAITTEEFEERLIDRNERSISSRDASYYVLKTSSLGWINCDRFISGKTKRIEYKIKIKNADGANVNMVFKSLNSILPSSYSDGVYDFKTVGAKEDVILVAIKRKEGKLFYDTVETKTKKNPKIVLDFKEVNLEELKKELEKLNNTFD